MSTVTSPPVNVAAFLPQVAARRPDMLSLVSPSGPNVSSWTRTTAAELNARCDALAHGLARSGLRRGDRVCLFARPGADWVALVYALFKLAAVPVLIDPGMGRKNMLSCVERMRPRGFIGIPLAQALRVAFPRAFKSVEVSITADAPRLWSGLTLRRIATDGNGPFETAATAPDEEAAILFTSGSTGPPKGVAYTHGNFAAQVEALRAMYDVQPGDVDLACFPLFALFGAALEMTTVLPDMDFSKPAACDPSKIVHAILEHNVVQTFGSPAIWKRVAPYCRDHCIRLDSMRRLMIAGAPVAPSLIEACLAVLPAAGDVHTPYGATESLPVASASGREILARFRERTEAGEGNCVGRPAPGIELRVIRITDEPIDTWSDDLELAPGELGELCVRGPVVTAEYKFEPEPTRAAKIPSDAGLWHRLGDIGRIDGEGNVWFRGRKSHRLQTEQGLMMPVGIENVFNLHDAIEKSALVGIGAPGSERPVLVVQTVPARRPRSGRDRANLAEDILRSAADHPECARVERVLFRPALPVDVRHNAKLKRGEIKRWAEEQLGQR